MRIFKTILFALLFAIVLFLAAGLFLPKNYMVSRSVSISAPPELVFEHLRQYRLFVLWSPWTALDPDMQNDIQNDGRPGAVYSWSGNDAVGAGKMAMTGMDALFFTEHRLEFERPFHSVNTLRFEQEQNDNQIKVRWIMKGEMPYPWNVFLLFFSPEKKIGPDFEHGLQNLKMRCEQMNPATVTQPKLSESSLIIHPSVFPETDVMLKKANLSFSDIAGFLNQHTSGMQSELLNVGAKPGHAMAVYYAYDEGKKIADMAVAIPYQGNGPSRSAYERAHWNSKKGWYIDYFGGYEGTYMAYDTLGKFLLKNTGSSDPALLFEEYIRGPKQESDPSRWHTRIWFFSER